MMLLCWESLTSKTPPAVVATRDYEARVMGVVWRHTSITSRCNSYGLPRMATPRSVFRLNDTLISYTPQCLCDFQSRRIIVRSEGVHSCKAEPSEETMSGLKTLARIRHSHEIQSWSLLSKASIYGVLRMQTILTLHGERINGWSSTKTNVHTYVGRFVVMLMLIRVLRVPTTMS